jgi:hypothetical protein
MKQREGPLCPICRRDFIVDPLDFLEGKDKERDDASSQERAQAPMFLWDQAQRLSADDLDGAGHRRLDPIVVMAPGY